MNAASRSPSRDPRAPAESGGAFLEREGLRLYYRDEGAGPALVLIHGWLMDLTAWDGIAPVWSAHYRVLRMDRRGFGRSTGRPDFARDAEDALALLDHCGVGEAAWLGMSQGARVALEIARRAPERVRALVLDGAPAVEGLPGGPWLQETPLERYRHVLATQGIEALRAELATHPLLQLYSREPAPRRTLDAMLAHYDGADLAEPPAAGRSRPVDFGALRMPVLIVNGARDTAQRLAVGAALERAIPRARRSVIAEAGHLACLDAPQAYARIVSDFLRESAIRNPTHTTELS